MAKLFGTNAQPAPISQSRIQPTGMPGSTFVRPQQREAGGNANALATALGSLNSALQNYSAVSQAVEEDPQSRANKEWIAKRQQMSLDDLKNEVVNNTPNGNRIQQDALEAMLGERANNDFRPAWQEFYNTEFDRTNGNAAEEYERMRQEFAAGLPSDVARGNFYRLTNDHFGAWMQKDTEEKVAYAKQELNTTVVEGFKNSIDDARSIHGKTAAEAAQAVFDKSAANKTFIGLSGQEQNDSILQTAQAYALNGDEEMARALLTTPRNGVPALASIPAYADKAFSLIEQAGNIRDRETRKNGYDNFVKVDDMVRKGSFTDAEAQKFKGTGLFTDEQLSSQVAASKNNLIQIQNKAAAEQAKRTLRETSERQEDSAVAQAFNAMEHLGGINRLKDIQIVSPTGEGTKTLTRQQQIDRVIEMKEQGWNDAQEKLVNEGTDPAQARAQINRVRLDWYAGNRVDNRAWINTLNGIAGRASMDTLLQKGEVTEYLKDSAKLYRDLKASNPAYLSTFLSDAKSKEFLEAYDNAVSNRRMPENEALLFASHVTSQPENLKAKSRMSYDNADKLADKTLRDLGLDARSWNRQPILNRISSMSANGATEREVKDALEADLLDTAVPINGVLVPDHRDLPEDFPDLMQLELSKRFPEIAKQYGIADESDLFIFPDGSESRWYIGSKSLGGMPVNVADPITPRTLDAHREERRAEQEERVRKLARARDAERAELKRQYDSEISEERKRIDFWRNASTKRQGLRKTLAEGVADKLQNNLDERLARDAERISYTPAERGEKRNQKLRKQADENARNLGFGDDMRR
ncbi:hypothetical protein [Agrobacterium tumefaciens]|uniref:hypothetical protein n=1 Tax=Agrobacterium tumefaciens TaxID=358 RepID=UPI0015735582|nr:hypothetical protein [Agrobacterium tumefaciens]